MLREIQSRIKEPFYVGLRNTVLAQIKSGKFTEDMELSSVLDSLDTVQLTVACIPWTGGREDVENRGLTRVFI